MAYDLRSGFRPQFHNGSLQFTPVEGQPVQLGCTAWEYLQLGGLAEGRLPDVDEVLDLAGKAGLEVSRTEVARLLEGFLTRAVVVDGVEYHLEALATAPSVESF
ncbi:MAG TPA: hypothetical protein VE398_22090 [Acidobacteriota bacterium]|nr:hypothetical protein [Acidobacteriota bacterium]